MIFLITIWVLSFLAVVSSLLVSVYGEPSVKSQRYLARGIPVSIWDLFILTYKDILNIIVDKWHDVLPYIHNAITFVLSKLIAHRDRTYARVLGYHAVPQGGAVSFFLKRIVAHKEEFKKKVANKRAVHDLAYVPEKKKDYFGELKGELRDL